MKSRQIFNALESLALLIKENREVREKNKELTDLLTDCLRENDNLKNEKDDLVSKNGTLREQLKEGEKSYESLTKTAHAQLKCLEQVREENESLKEENKGLKRDVCKLNEFIDNNVEVLRQENKLLKEDRDELLEQLKKETAPFEKQVTRLMLENRRLTKQLEESYELHALKEELQKELKEHTDISPKLEIKGGGEFKISERPLSLAQKQEDFIRKSGRGF